MPPGCLSLKVFRLQLGSRAPEFVTMRVFSVTPESLVLHARMRFVGDDLQAVLVGHLITGRLYAGVLSFTL